MGVGYRIMNIALIYGGETPEHHVSAASARHTAEHLTGNIILIGVSENGRWYLQDTVGDCIDTSREVSVIPGKGFFCGTDPVPCDVVFPVIHGSFGEDGGMQGLLASLPLPAVTCSIESSALGMSKYLAKQLCRSLEIPTAPSLMLRKGQSLPQENSFGYPLFIKPDRCGSSIGVSRADGPEDLPGALENAFLYDERILVEQTIPGYEIQCAWMSEKDGLSLSCLGEIHSPGLVHSYRIKYIESQNTRYVIPSSAGEALQQNIYSYIRKLLEALSFPLYGRIDFLYNPADNTAVFNEVNTSPGMTAGSMYPKLWKHTGREYKDLLDDLIQASLYKYEKHRSICRFFDPGEGHES